MTKKKIERMDDEIDLFELIEYLWKEKVLIVAITALITLIGSVLAIKLVLIRNGVGNRKLHIQCQLLKLIKTIKNSCI